MMKPVLYLAVVLAATGMSCKKQYYQYTKSLVDIQKVEAGESCANGGYVILNGNDINFNGTLDSNEVESREYICNGADAESDKKVVLSFDIGPSTTYAGTGVEPRIYGIIPKFNKLDYSNVSAIKLYVNMSSYSPDAAGTEAKVELYNSTDGEVIEGSTITASSPETFAYFESGDFYSSLPEKDVNLAFRISATTDDGVGSLKGCYVIIYKK